MGNPVVHFEIGTGDVARSGAFYSDLFGWHVDVDPAGYGVVHTGADAGIDGGLTRTPQGRPSVSFYVGVDDLEQALARAEELGGRRHTPRTPVGGVGAFAAFTDPDGNVIGLFAEH